MDGYTLVTLLTILLVVIGMGVAVAIGRTLAWREARRQHNRWG